MGARMTFTSEKTFSPLQWTDLLLSSHFFSDRIPAGQDANELVLQWAVFTDGLQRYWTLAADRDSHLSEEFREEETWLLDDDREWPFSFVNLCEAFGFQTDSLRASLLTRKVAHQADVVAEEQKKKAVRGVPQI